MLHTNRPSNRVGLIRTLQVEKELRRVKANKKCTSEFQRYILSLTASALEKTYGSNFSDQCLQSSLGIQMALKHYGITSTLIEGALCIPTASLERSNSVWQGFWNNHHHYWLVTEFDELIDLTISQINSHPATGKERRADPPAFWFHDVSYLPAIFKYLPSDVIPHEAETFLEDKSDNELLQQYLAVLKSTLSLNNKILYHPRVETILNSTDDLTSWHKKGDKWSQICWQYNVNEIPLPAWIVNRENELLKLFTVDAE